MKFDRSKRRSVAFWLLIGTAAYLVALSALAVYFVGIGWEAD